MSSVPFPRRFSPFQAARDEFLLTLEAEDRAPATVDKYRTALARFALFAGEVDPDQIDASLLRRWIAQLRAEGLASSTQRDYLTWIKTWLRWLAGEGGYAVEAARFERAKPPRVIEEPTVPFSEEEIARLFAGCPKHIARGQRLRAILIVLLDTGVRAAELRGLRLRDVDMEQGDIVVLPTTDKTRKGRTIALGRRGKLEVRRYWSRCRGGEGFDQRGDAAFFLNEDGKPYTKRNLQKLLERLGERTGVANVHPHRFRHTFALRSLRAGMDPFVLMHTLGHKDMAMTKRYLNIVGSDVREQKRATSWLDSHEL